MISRNRYVELTEIANKVVTLVRGEGVTYTEGCSVSKLASDLWNLEFPNEKLQEESAQPQTRLRVDEERPQRERR